ncbi:MULTISPECIES: site-specific integrase [unclassified Mesorhizobium]|uniref:site-specific integrase n=1 Tax=unclassified Mesorhizobium TaxID=325217 RepID=UPI000FCBFD86|nr:MULTISPECIES: site-specific integrase [unclassified Mesorhizobium]TGP27967.1 site-specific integrase [Mesorhizobium sp. M2D.F.Ca.ET.232.01.1.1]TGQ25556.1 site-specific integrase [Mesorhizobium sp. M00.F.Ca.ET.220.01.1.1]TGT97828.1 site-specific integrase [bacterium M00.F.Ca.ET.163.01.1.1]
MARYLKRRGKRGIWYFQRAIPPELKGKVDSKLFRDKSLETTDEHIAEKAARKLIVATDDAIDRARALAKAPDYVGNLTPAERSTLDEAGGIEFLRNEIASDAKQYRFLDAAAVMSALIPEDMFVDRIAAQLQRLDGKADSAQLAELSQIIREKARTLHKLGVVVDEIKDMTSVTDPGLYEVVNHWAESTKQPDQTKRQFTYAVRRFCEINGDMPVKELTKEHIRKFADRLPELPANVPVNKLDLTFDQIVFLGERKGWKTVSEATVTKHIQGLRAIVNHAVGQGFLDTNPFEGFRNVKAKGKKSDAKDDGRKPFSPTQLQHLFSTLSAEKTPRDDDFWVPYIALYQGARLEEICQLDKADFVTVNHVPCFRITDALDELAGDTGKKVKNSASVRTIPVHPRLLAMGFAQHVGRSKGAKLFCSFEQDKRGRYGGPYGKRFARLLREKAEIADKQLVFHSFRHTWTDAARNAGVPVEIRERLAGREASKGSEKGYGEGFSPAVLLEHLAKVDPLAIKPAGRTPFIEALVADTITA